MNFRIDGSFVETRAFSPCAGAQRARAKSPCHMGAIVFVQVLALVWIAEHVYALQPPCPPTVGIEGQVQLHLPGSSLLAKPVTDKSPIVLRIASATVGPNGGFYDLRYIGLEPGKYDLRDYLLRADGTALGSLDPISVTISPLLPEDHNGQLTKMTGARWPWFGGYRNLLIAVVAIWVLLLIPLMMLGKRRRTELATERERPETFADRIRPLMERASMGGLCAQDQSVLERLLLSYWQRRLDLTTVEPSAAIVSLRADPVAGELLRTLEDWLHRPPGTVNTSVDVASLLQPYQDSQEPLVAAAEATEGGRA